MKKYKRLLSAFLAVMMLLSVASFATAAEKATFAVGSMDATPGTTIDIPVTITDNVGFGSTKLYFTIPAGWTLNGIAMAKSATERSCLYYYDEMTFGYATKYNPTPNVAEKSLTIAASVTEDFTADGTLCWLKVTLPAADVVVNGEYTVGVSAASVYKAANAYENVISNFEFVSGKITVTGGISREDIEPQFKAALTDQSFTYGNAAPTLDATATVVKTDNAETYPTYQWYKTDSKEADGTAINGATSATYTHGLSAPSACYYCVVTNVFNGETYTARTDTVQVTANKMTPDFGEGNSETDCYNSNCRGYHVYDGKYHGYYAWWLWTGDYAFLRISSRDLTYKYAPVVDGEVGAFTTTKPTAVGTYNFYVSFAGNDYWEGVTNDLCDTFTIHPAGMTALDPYAMTVYVGGGTASLPAERPETVDGTTAEVSVEITSGGDLIELDAEKLTVKAKGTATGSAVITMTFTAANHNSSTRTINVTVANKQEAAVTFTKKNDGTYDGKARELSKFVNAATADQTGGDITYTMNGETVTLDTMITNAGTYTVVAKYEDAIHLGTATVTINIAPKSVAIPTAESGLVYDPAKQDQIGVVDGEGFSLTGNTGKDAGGYTAVATLDSANYIWSDNTKADKSIPWSIAKATIAVSSDVKWNYSEPYTYNGSEKTVELTGLDAKLTASYTGNTATNAGTYRAKATISVKDDYSKNYEVSGSVADLEWKINPASVDCSDVTFTQSDIPYDGEAHTVAVTNLPEHVTVSYTGDAVTQTNAGTYTTTATLTPDKNYALTGNSVLKLEWKIVPAEVAVPTAVEDLVYNGTEKTGVTAAALGTLYNLESGVITATDVGKYTAIFALKDAANYKWANDSFTGTVEWSIAKDAALTLTDSVSHRYSDTETKTIAPSALHATAGDIVITGVATTDSGGILNGNAVLGNDGNVTYALKSGLTAADKDKTATVTVTFTSKNYEASTYALTVTVIDKNQITVTFPNGSAVYTGETQTYENASVDSAYTGTITYTYSSAVKDVGDYTVTAVYEDADNYGTATATFIVNPAKISVKDGAAVTAKTYNGDKTATVPTVEFTGLKGEDTVDYTVSAEFNSADVKTANKVTYTVTLADSVKNYVLDDATGETDATIAPAPINVTIGDIGGVTYTGAAITPVPVVTATGTVGSYELVKDTDYTVSYDNNTNVGTATVTVTAKDGSNYTFGTATKTFAISKADLTVNAEDITVTYTGKALTSAAIKGTAKFNGTNVSGTWSFVSSTEMTNAGTYSDVSVRFTPDSANFNVATCSITVVINKAKLAIPTARTGLVYTGSAQKGVVTADDLQTYVDVVAGSVFQTNAGNFVATFAIRSDCAANYQWADGTDTDKKISWSIAKADPTGEPEYTKITSSGKTLADAELKVGTITPAGGTIIWVDENGAELAADTKVENNTAYTWKYTPAADDAGNYNELTGTIVLYNYVPIILGSPVSVAVAENGNVSLSTGSAVNGATVTVTVVPDEGYEVSGLTIVDRFGNVVPVTDIGGGKYTFIMPATGVTVSAEFEKVNRTVFTDVSAKDWFHDAVYYAYDNGLMNGVGGTSFAPKANLTRAMLMTVLARLDGVDTSGGALWYTKGMEWAVENGISDGTMPEVNITREQAVTMLYRYVGKPAVSKDNLADVPDGAEVSSWAVDAMNWAIEVGLIKGDENGETNPNGTATRAEIATMLMRFIENVIK